MAEASLASSLAQGRQQFLELVAAVRPELHRYCARLTGSAIDGEDVVQDVLAKAFFQLSMSVEVPALRPWLFRVAHNAAVDYCRRYERTHAYPLDAALEAAGDAGAGDPELVRLALSAFLVLPLRQRSAVILKDVLGMSLEEIAGAMDATVPAVKSALVRGREGLRRATPPSLQAANPADFRDELERLNRYAALFNARDWDGLRGLLTDEARLDLVSQAARQGKGVGQYYGRYANDPDVRVAVGFWEGRPALALHRPASAPQPAYFILLNWDGGRVSFIRDFRYAPYVAEGARFQPVAGTESFAPRESS